MISSCILTEIMSADRACGRPHIQPPLYTKLMEHVLLRTRQNYHIVTSWEIHKAYCAGSSWIYDHVIAWPNSRRNIGPTMRRLTATADINQNRSANQWRKDYGQNYQNESNIFYKSKNYKANENYFLNSWCFRLSQHNDSENCDTNKAKLT